MNGSKTSLKQQFIKHLFYSLLSALLLFSIVYSFALTWYTANKNTPLYQSHQAQEMAVSFQRYLIDYHISSHQDKEIQAWCQKHSNPHLLIHESENIRGGDGRTFALDFYDGTYWVTFLNSKPHIRERNLVKYAFIISLLFFLWVNYHCFNQRYLGMKSLYLKLENLYKHPLEPIVENAILEDYKAMESHLSKLQNKLIHYIEKDLQHEQVTSDLLASLSHDFKTPLAVIIGYMEIVKDRFEESRDIVHKSIQRAQYLQQLVDDALYYFHSTSSATSNRLTEVTNCYEMLQHFTSYQKASIGERCTLINHLTYDPTLVEINDLMMHRLFDNLISNLLKYADFSHAIVQTNYVENGWFIFEQRNTIDPNKLKKPSTMLGIKTCKRIMTLHHGKFDFTIHDHVFTCQLYFPLAPKV